MAKVYLFQEPVPNSKGWIPNLSPAAKYGAIEYVFGKNDHPASDPVKALGQIVKKLASFDPHEDYVCWANAGDIASVYMIMPFLTKQGFASIRALHWHKDGAYYLPIEIPLNPAA